MACVRSLPISDRARAMRHARYVGPARTLPGAVLSLDAGVGAASHKWRSAWWWSKEWDGGGASREHAAVRPNADREAFLY